jgi:hypothetical protein
MKILYSLFEDENENTEFNFVESIIETNNFRILNCILS